MTHGLSKTRLQIPAVADMVPILLAGRVSRKEYSTADATVCMPYWQPHNNVTKEMWQITKTC